MTRAGRARLGFTLIELLVVMSLIATLAAMAMMIAPQAMERDRSAEAVNSLTGAMQIARARAMRDGAPRGIRLVANGAQAAEFQAIEAPPVFVPNPDGPSGSAYVQFDYTLNASNQVLAGGRQCQILGLTQSQQQQIWASVQTSVTAVGAAKTTLALPTLGGWYSITGAALIGTNGLNLTLADYPDFQLGGQLHWRTYHFGIYSPPRALLGEPVLPLPRDTAVDLGLTFPAGAAGVDYDILFGPGGQLISTASTRGAGQVFLVIRDPSRVSPATNPDQAGEVMVLGIKAKSGGIGAAPWDWTDPFSLARKAVSAQ